MTTSSSASAPARERKAQSFAYVESTQNPGQGSPSGNSSKSLYSGHGVEAPCISEQDLSRLVAEAKADGLRQGAEAARQEFQKELQRVKQQTGEMVQAFAKQRSDYFANVETQLVHFALAIAARILHREAEVDRLVVAGLVRVMLDKLEQGSHVKIHVRPEESSGWRHYFHEHAHVQIVDDSAVEPHGCLLENQLGIADMGLDSQLKELEKGFFDLLAQRQETK